MSGSDDMVSALLQGKAISASEAPSMFDVTTSEAILVDLYDPDDDSWGQLVACAGTFIATDRWEAITGRKASELRQETWEL